jgi:LPS sulfotransferase NodH
MYEFGIPETDFVSSLYDSENQYPLKQIIFILSTPRSGSTLACNLMHQNSICTPHEYFQPFQYMPILSERWMCRTNDGQVLFQEYTRKVIENRTAASGFLGINAHGSHLSLLEKALPLFPDVPVTWLFLQRFDLIAQSVSYYWARSTRKWSSDFEGSRSSPKYSFEKIYHCYQQIVQQNREVNAFLRQKSFKYQPIVYERIRADLDESLRREIGRGITQNSQTLQHQMSDKKADHAIMFANDLRASRW